MSFTSITVTATYLNADGSTADGGYVTFTLSNKMTDSTDLLIVDPTPIQGTVNSSGQLLNSDTSGPLVLYATDDPTTTPTGTVYEVSEHVNGSAVSNYLITLPHNASGGTVDLSQIAPTSSASPVWTPVALGLGSAPGDNALGLGAGSIANGDNAVAIGEESAADGEGSVTLAAASTATTGALFATTMGYSSLAYAPGQMAHAGNEINAPGDAQYSRVVLCTETTDATPTMLETVAGPFAFTNSEPAPTYLRTALLRGRVMARRTDVPGTDAAWSFQGIVRGNGISSYSWVGGSAPTATLIARDSAASSWGFTVAMDGTTTNQLDITVTGEAGQTIIWECTLEVDETAGPATSAFVVANAAPSLPVTITTGSNDEFIFTQEGGSPETFTMAGGTYSTLNALQGAMAAATGSTSGEAFSEHVEVTENGTKLVLTANGVGPSFNGSTITYASHNAAAALGFTGNPDTFGGGYA